MASGAAALALKAAVVTAVLAVLVLPSLGRCPSLGPEPPAAPAPAPAPPISCDDCFSNCFSAECSDCSEYCDLTSCPECSSPIIKRCEADCCSKGECGTCNCDRAADGRCYGACYDPSCRTCQSCRSNCDSVCKATCV